MHRKAGDKYAEHPLTPYIDLSPQLSHSSAKRWPSNVSKKKIKRRWAFKDNRYIYIERERDYSHLLIIFASLYQSAGNLEIDERYFEE